MQNALWNGKTFSSKLIHSQYLHFFFQNKSAYEKSQVGTHDEDGNDDGDEEDDE